MIRQNNQKFTTFFGIISTNSANKLLQSKIHPIQLKRSERIPFVQITVHANARQVGDASFLFLSLYDCHSLSKKSDDKIGWDQSTANSVGKVLTSLQ